LVKLTSAHNHVLQRLANLFLIVRSIFPLEQNWKPKLLFRPIVKIRPQGIFLVCCCCCCCCCCYCCLKVKLNVLQLGPSNKINNFMLQTVANSNSSQPQFITRVLNHFVKREFFVFKTFDRRRLLLYSSQIEREGNI